MSGELALVGDISSLLKRLEKAANDKVPEDMLEAIRALDRLDISLALLTVSDPHQQI